MKNKIKLLGLFIIILATSCKTETHSNLLNEEESNSIETVISDTEEESLMGEQLRDEITGSWSLNSQPGQIDFNEDGTYKNCVFYNTAANDAETESCLNGSWTIDEDKVVIILNEGDTVTNSVTWVFDNVVYLGFEDAEIGDEEGWENGMTKL